MIYHKRLKELRKERHLSQEYIAKILKTTQPQYALYENGSRELPIKHLITLSYFYGVTTDYILGRTNNRKLF